MFTNIYIVYVKKNEIFWVVFRIEEIRDNDNETRFEREEKE